MVYVTKNVYLNTFNQNVNEMVIIGWWDFVHFVHSSIPNYLKVTE